MFQEAKDTKGNQKPKNGANNATEIDAGFLPPPTKRKKRDFEQFLDLKVIHSLPLALCEQVAYTLIIRQTKLKSLK